MFVVNLQLRKGVYLFALVIVSMIAAGCTVPIQLPPGSTTTLSRPVIAVAPLSGGPGTQIAVSGSGWQPDDVITLKIQSADQSQEVTIFSFTTDSAGSFSTSFTLPDISQWQLGDEVRVVAVSSTPAQRAVMAFSVSTTVPLAADVAPVPARPVAEPPTPTATVPSDGRVARVTSPGLNIRSGPSVAYPVIVDVSRGEPLTVLGQNASGSWLQVRLNNGIEGWAARFYTDFQPSVLVVRPAAPVPVQATPTFTPIPIVQSPITEWRGEYYPNRDLAGPPAYIRNDSNIDFNWDQGAPSGFGPDNFSIRWTRNVDFSSDEYRFHVRMDDGARLYVDNSLVIDDWRDNSVREVTGDIWLGSGVHTIRVEYYEHTGAAQITVWWERKRDATDSDDDDDDDETENDDSSFPDWKGEYFTNRHLDGNPRFRRNDKRISFNWGNDSPSSRIPDHDFSVRWSRFVNFEPGRYRFNVRVDDGVRVYINGDRIINEWHDNAADEIYSAERNLDGGTDIRVDYFERRGGALIDFWWERVDVPPVPTATPIPDTPLPPTATGIPLPPTATPTIVQPSANVQPSSGGVGTSITVTGGAFRPQTELRVYLGALAGVSAAAVDQEVYATTTTDSAGSYAVTFTMPDTWPGGAPIAEGKILIMLSTADSGQQASAVFDYVPSPPTPTPTPTGTLIPTATATPTFTPIPTEEATPTPVPQPFVNINPASGGPDTLVNVNGGGFLANIQVCVYLGLFDGNVDPSTSPVNYACTLTDNNGGYAMSVLMPLNAPDGRPVPTGNVVILVASNDFGLRTTALFNYTAPPPAESRSAPEGQSSDSSGE